MTRWSHLDTDEERLPHGLVRAGYDADTQTYTFRDVSDGSIWEGSPGCEYGGHMTQISGPTNRGTSTTNSNSNNTFDVDDNDGVTTSAPSLPEYSEHQYPPGYYEQPPLKPSWRRDMGPFLNFVVILGLFMVGMFWYVNSSANDMQAEREKGGFMVGGGGGGLVQDKGSRCEERGLGVRVIGEGDTCWGIAEEVGVNVEEIMALNEEVDCDGLWVGGVVCVP